LLLYIVILKDSAFSSTTRPSAFNNHGLHPFQLPPRHPHFTDDQIKTTPFKIRITSYSTDKTRTPFCRFELHLHLVNNVQVRTEFERKIPKLL
ncbi:hypothetical protein, partial [Enterococcus faecium]|uniref:hypothetical protein n=1 Tax=Enterococcus faecium TaxID=1352 RepID=UPI001C9BC48D